MNSHHEDRGWKVPVPTALANANAADADVMIFPTFQQEAINLTADYDAFKSVHVPDPRDVEPRDVQGVAETRKEHHAHAEQGDGLAAVPSDGKQGHPRHGKHDGTGRDQGKLLMKKGDHEQHDHNGVQELDSGGDAARHVVQAVKKQQRCRGIHEAHAR